MKALLKSHHTENKFTLKLVDVSDDYDFGSCQSIVSIEDENFPPDGEVLHGSPYYETPEVIKTAEFCPDHVVVNFDSGEFTRMTRDEWDTLIRDRRVVYDLELGDGSRAVECVALPTNPNPTVEELQREIEYLHEVIGGLHKTVARYRNESDRLASKLRLADARAALKYGYHRVIQPEHHEP